MSIKVKGISKIINRQPIITEVSFEWPAARIIGLVGQNGAGKTTLFRTMADHYLPDAGSLLIDEQEVVKHPSMRQQLFYIDTQHNFFGALTLKQIAAMYARGYSHFDGKRFQQLLMAEQLSATSHYQQLSKGQRMLSQILLALVSGAPYVILDEPFDGLDILVRERIVARIVSEAVDHQTSFLISSHNLEELDGLCDQALFLKDHRLVETMIWRRSASRLKSFN
ncbi:ABC transporter ATP-binding protein [Lactiplantibacillus sp. WILCCON 0030]|uniref:ABC transporter ATP-binding protein n=1 Tax=Lactiplantibacillus brownii TaxID=3069269 RepID=A0ABU1AA90_9LACO|nr:ABC transporter ATP-binding protein [Lactiplantibacillus brownii]MDQ7937545.1 ABC transporter ATP-binding protein [Lactiplantibacillus brownii]